MPNVSNHEDHVITSSLLDCSPLNDNANWVA